MHGPQAPSKRKAHSQKGWDRTIIPHRPLVKGSGLCPERGGDRRSERSRSAMAGPSLTRSLDREARLWHPDRLRSLRMGGSAQSATTVVAAHAAWDLRGGRLSVDFSNHHPGRAGSPTYKTYSGNDDGRRDHPGAQARGDPAEARAPAQGSPSGNTDLRACSDRHPCLAYRLLPLPTTDRGSLPTGAGGKPSIDDADFGKMIIPASVLISS
jgi:hypothetical protein